MASGPLRRCSFRMASLAVGRRSLYAESRRFYVLQGAASHQRRQQHQQSEHLAGDYDGATVLLFLATASSLTTAAAVALNPERCQEVSRSSPHRIIETKRPLLTSFLAGANPSLFPPLFVSSRTFCNVEEELEIDRHDDKHAPGYSESERFFESLEYHRTLLSDYIRRWFGPGAEKHEESVRWPRKIPTTEEVGRLEVDLSFCKRSPNYRDLAGNCQDEEFRIACYYLAQKDDPESHWKGYKMVKDLAEHGHPDGMCLYGIILSDGRVEGVDANPEEAVVWWRRCVDFHRHIAATYELAVALYTGEGVAENAERAVLLFRRAAHLGHAGAAYLLGECLLDGVGTEPDRSNALEWLVTSAELGHQLARARVIYILNQDYQALNEGDAVQEDPPEEALKWVDALDEENQEKVQAVNIERRFTIGGGSRNPAVLAKRKTKVQESRDL